MVQEGHSFSRVVDICCVAPGSTAAGMGDLWGFLEHVVEFPLVFPGFPFGAHSLDAFSG